MAQDEQTTTTDLTELAAEIVSAYVSNNSVQVSDLQIQKRDNLIVISTYGRGVWVMDILKLGRE